MASKIVPHIGLQKSGTTFLQHMLRNNAETLTEAGVLYPVPQDWERGKRTVANMARYASRHPAAARRLCKDMGFAVDGGADDYREVGTHIPFVRFTPRP